MRARVVELFSDCERCKVEASVVERYDPLVPACAFGVPAATRCRLCGVAFEAVLVTSGAELRETSPARALGSRDEVLEALGAWAREDGFADVGALVRATFVLPDASSIAAAIAGGAPIETVADPFARGPRAISATSAPRADAADGGHAKPPASAPESPKSAPPLRALLYPLVSVVAADGELHPGERALLNRFLAEEGMAPLEDHEVVVHPPAEIARHIPNDKRARLVELMCELVAADGMPDASELRVIHAYASAFRVPRADVDRWLEAYGKKGTSAARRIWLALRGVVSIGAWRTREDP